MKEQNDRRTDPLARELKESPLANFEQIGKELRNDFAELITEELPAEIQALLEKLEQKLDRT